MRPESAQEPGSSGPGASGSNDYQAIKNGRVGKRITRRAAGRLAGRGLGRIFR
jgi:hypothetical protein